MVSGIPLFADRGIQAQIGSGSGSGGAVGQGGPEIIRPGHGNDGPREGAMKQGSEASGTMGTEGAIIVQPKPGENGAPGSGRPPDRSTPNAATKEGHGSGSGSGHMDSSGGTGSDGNNGSSSGAEGARR